MVGGIASRYTAQLKATDFLDSSMSIYCTISASFQSTCDKGKNNDTPGNLLSLFKKKGNITCDRHVGLGICQVGQNLAPVRCNGNFVMMSLVRVGSGLRSEIRHLL